MPIFVLVLGLCAAASESPATAPEPLSFAEAIDRALSRNPTVATAVEEVERSRGLLEQTRSSALPQLNGVGTYTRLDADRVLQDRIILGANQLNATLSLSVPVIAPRVWANVTRANDVTEVTKTLLADVRRLIALSTGRAFLTVIAQHRVVEVTQRARDVARAQLAFAQDRLRGGVGNRLDVTRSGQELQTAEAQLQTALGGVTRAQEALGVLVGAEGPIEAKGEPTLAAPETLAPTLQRVGDARTDVLANRKRVDSAKRSVGLHWTDFMPFLTANGQAALQDPPTLTQPTRTWQVGLVLTLPLYDGGLRYGQQKERVALEHQAEVGLAGTLRQARAEVRTAFESLRRADSALEASREGARLASESLGLAELAYRTGVSTNLELVDAQRRARDADTSAAVAEDTARQARLDLLAASGAFP